MDYGSIIGESFEYAKEAFWGKWTRWLLLIISTIIFPLIYGYMMEVYRGKKPAPEPEHWWRLFVDGIKLLVAGLIYAIPALIVFFLTIGLAILTLMPYFVTYSATGIVPTAPSAALATAIGSIIVGAILTVIIAFITALFALLGMVRLARTGRFGEAFNFHEIHMTIKRIGWGSYILALIIMWILSAIFSVVISLFMIIPYIGWLIMLIFLPVWVVFEARYITQVYDAGMPPEAPQSPVQVQVPPPA